jgi:hypothetical protein
MWTPFDLKLILHFHSCLDKPDSANAPIYRERVDNLMNAGLVEYREGIPRTTELGDAFVGLLLSTPIPVVKYVDPRFADASA